MEKKLKLILPCAALLCALIWAAVPRQAAPAENTAAEAAAEPDELADPLLVLVNRDNPVPADWKVTPCLVDDEIVDIRVYAAYTAMYEDAAEDGVWLWAASGYRSEEEQAALWEKYTAQRMAEGMTAQEARADVAKTVAEPGCSEHHTGLAIDFNDVSDGFEDTPAYRWLDEHAAEYGFIQRYRRDKAAITHIENESWHYRYVGKKHAMRMKELDMCLEEYVEYLGGGRR